MTSAAEVSLVGDLRQLPFWDTWQDRQRSRPEPAQPCLKLRERGGQGFVGLGLCISRSAF